MVLAGGLVSFFIVVSAVVPLAGWVFFAGGAAYIAAYYFDIIYHTLNEEQEVPSWPELSSYWDDIIIPGAQMLGIFIFSGLPLFASYWYFPDDSVDGQGALYLLGLICRWIYFPMATLAVICHGSVWAALPHRVVPALLRCLPGYLLCAATFALAEILQSIFSDILGMAPFIGWFLPWVIYMYVMIAQARLTGLIYLRYRDRIPWGT